MNDHRVYAGLGPRFLAFIIDLILVNLVAGVFFALAWSTIVTAGGDGAVLDRNVLFTWNVRDIGRAAFMALYFAVFTRAFGGTVGKLWLGIHVVTPDGERIGFGTALYRETVGRFLSSIFFLGYLPALFSEKHVSLHDWLSGTRVVNVRSCLLYTSQICASKRERSIRSPSRMSGSPARCWRWPGTI